ncbi:DEAD/DEAH box helicase [Corynebacterium sp. 35RC1]|nr:DEAD/DEAH box helicase [Corynebacterium sp. 35RC1]
MADPRAAQQGTPAFLLHGLWLQESGLHLWIEQVEGHKIMVPENVDLSVFPDAVRGLLEGKRFAHLIPVTLLTPKGRRVQLKIPTAAYTPEQAVRVLATLSAIGPTTASDEQIATLAPDVVWLARMYQGLDQFVRAGRLTFKVGYADRQWWPTWQLAAGLAERGWIAQMSAAAPGVIIANGGSTVAQSIAQELPHWIANAHLRVTADAARPMPWHDFVGSLLRSTPMRRGSANLVSALNKWRNSVQSVNFTLVFSVEEASGEVLEANEDADITTAIWPVRVQVRAGSDAPMAMADALQDKLVAQRLEEMHGQAVASVPMLNPNREMGSEYAMDLAFARAAEHASTWDAYLTTDELMQFISQDVEVLRKQGFTVMLPKAWDVKETKAKLHVEDPAESAVEPKLGLDQIVDFRWEISVGDTTLTPDEMTDLVRSKSGLILLRGKWVMADAQSLRRATKYMTELAKHSKKRRKAEIEKLEAELELARAATPVNQAEIAALEAELARMKEAYEQDFTDPGAITLGELRQLAMESADPEVVEYAGSKWHQALIGGLQATDLPAPVRVEIPPQVHAELREYQRRGVDWLYWMAQNHVGAVLADDMGLGKTLQLLALEAVERFSPARDEGVRALGASESGPLPTLIVAPTSVVENWRREAQKFVPELKVMVHHGSSRAKGEELVRAVHEVDLVISSYGTVLRDSAVLAGVHFRRVVLDEAQRIKNASNNESKAVRSLPSDHRVALTGTPVENRLTEIRSILDFCNPGVLGSASFFRNHFARAIERYQDEVRIEQLKTLTAPLILRRLKTDPAIISDLPEKTENIITVPMTKEQAALYKAYVEQLKKQLEEAPTQGRRALVLASLTRIKQICNHPAHFLGDDSPILIKGRHRSGKMQELMNLLDQAVESGRKVLIFTQYAAFGNMLQPFLSEYFGEHIPFLYGAISKKDRDKMVQNFQRDDGPKAMLLSLRAGGTGLNLTQASVVVHMDRWWNPAVENQATDRAYRIGQRQDVTVYKMITAGTIEESIQDIIDGKTKLASTIVGDGEGWLTELSVEELSMLLSYRGQ